MALNIGELVGFIRADDSGMRRGLSDAELRMRGFARDAEGRLRHLDGRFANTGELAALGLRQGTDEGHRFSLSLGRIAGMVGGLGGVAASVGRIAAMLGTAVPAAAGLVATLANIVPAAGVGVTAMLALKQATLAVKLGTQGMDAALKLALDPDKAEEFEKALEKLSPEARQFARAVRGLGPEFRKLQQDVQDELFRGLAENLERTAKVVLPVLRRELVNTSLALGDMAAGAMGAARDLAENGTLGKAMGSASMGLRNLSGLPSIVVTALGQIAAAAGPSFEGLTAAAAHSANQIGQKLGDAFESGRMQEAIQNAIDLLGDIVDVGMNVGEILGSVFSAAQVSGGGFIGTLQEITGALADAFASPAVQQGLQALFQTMATVAQTVAPLLGQALAVIAPVLSELGPPVQILVKALGSALSPIIEALAPVLEGAASAVGILVEAISPLLPVVGELVAALLPALTPILDAISDVFAALAPVVEEVAGILQDTLSPILATLPGIIEPIVQLLAARLIFFLQFLGDLLVALGPTLVILGEAFGELLVALTPVIEALSGLIVTVLEGLMPLIGPLIGLIGGLIEIFATGLAAIITGVVVPVLEFLGKLLSGDFAGAWEMAKDAAMAAVDLIADAAGMIGPIVADAIAAAVSWLTGLPGRAASALSSLPSALGSKAAAAGRQMVNATRQGISDAITWVKGLPGRAAKALGSIGNVLLGAGKALIRGFIDGISSMFGSVKSTLGDLTGSLTSWKGPEDLDKRILTPAGRSVIRGFQRGITDQTPGLRQQLQDLTQGIPGMTVPGYALPGGGTLPGTATGAAPQQKVLLEFRSSGSEFDDWLVERIRKAVDVKGGGDVQAAFGRGKRR